MNELVEFAYKGRDNSIDIELREDDVALDITGLTRATLELEDQGDAAAALVLVDSSLHANVFDWTTLGASGVLVITLGNMATPPPPADYNARLTVYDAVNVKGLVWTHERTTGCEGTRLVVRILDVPAGVAA